MPVFYIMCGLPFSGKSTLAGQIAAATGAVLVSYDALWQEKMTETGRSFGFEELCDLAEGRLALALANGESAVYDTLNNSKGWRDRLGQIATRHGARPVVVYLNTPWDVIEARRRENETTRVRHTVTAETVREEARKFEAPHPPEPVIAFAAGTDIEVWLRTLAAAAN